MEERANSELKRLMVRHGNEYGGPLTWDYNELLWDMFYWYWPEHVTAKWDCSVEVTARLPDERVLFSYAQDFTVRWPPCHGGARGG